MIMEPFDIESALAEMLRLAAELHKVVSEILKNLPEENHSDCQDY